MEEHPNKLRTAARANTLVRFGAATVLLAFGFNLAPGAAGQTASPPAVTILENGGSLAEGFIFVGPQDIGAPAKVQGPEIIDNQGRVVWFLPTPGNMATDFRVQTYQGNPVLTWSQGITYGDTNAGDTTDYIADSTYKVIATVQAGNGYNADIHEFQLTPQGTALITIYNNLKADLSSVGGPTNGTVSEGVVQEIDVVTGKVLLEWHSLTDIALSESYAALPPPSSGIPYDYFHINSVKLDTDGNLLISSRHTWAVYKVNRTSGAIIWRLGGKRSDFALGPGLPFAWQHDVEAVDAKTIRIFDNESDGVPVLPYSRVLWVSHDDSAMTATIARSIVHPAQLSALAEGNAQALDNGDTFVEWGILGRISEFDPSGQLVFDASEAKGYGSYRGFRYPWVGNPSTAPTALALQNGDGSIAVHAIWNGATEVASWQVLAGAVAGSLGLAGTAPWNGLDTVITIPGPASNIQVVALDSSGTAVGTSATVSGPFAAVFQVQPASQTVADGRTAVFSATSSVPAATYQWMLNGSPVSNGAFGGAAISGATESTLIIGGASAADAGSYSCVVTSFGNSVTSNAATLAVNATEDAGRLVDISCRSAVGTGNGVLIIGFVVGGQGALGSDPVLVRASGPALAQFGISGVLADPELQLFGPSGFLEADSSWAGDSQVASVAAMVGAFPWNNDASMDSAVYTSLAAGPFTAVIYGQSGDTGVALGEVYDAEPAGSRVATTPRLINLSGRGQVGTGAGELIAGFVIGGTTSETVLVRGSGPALGQLGVSGALADPLLQLYRLNSDGTSTLIGSNAGWKADAQIAATAASVGAFSWGTSATADSAILMTLPPGAYTAGISGASGDTGISLVEVYEVP